MVAEQDGHGLADESHSVSTNGTAPPKVVEQDSPQLHCVPSLGSRGHPSHCGPPCKFAGRARGCRDGAACKACHLCKWSRRTHGLQGWERELLGEKEDPFYEKNTSGGTEKGEEKQSVPHAERPQADSKQSPDAPTADLVAVDAQTTVRSADDIEREQRLKANAAKYENLSDDELKALLPKNKGNPTSIGAMLHASSTCSPCRFFHFSGKGCQLGIRCLFCHECHKGLKSNGKVHSLPAKRSVHGRSESEDSNREVKKPRMGQNNLSLHSQLRWDDRLGEALDCYGNSRPCFLRDDEPVEACYGYGSCGGAVRGAAVNAYNYRYPSWPPSRSYPSHGYPSPSNPAFPHRAI